MDELETALCCVVPSSPTTWSSHLPWIEYANNTLTSTGTGLSPFEACLGYQPLFPAQEREEDISSIQLHLCCCHWVWKKAKAALLRTTVWQTKGEPLSLAVLPRSEGLAPRTFFLTYSSQKLSHRFIDPFEMEESISSSADCFKLSASMRIITIIPHVWSQTIHF